MLVLTNVPDINIRGKWVKDIRGLSVLCVQLFNFLKKNWNNLKYIILGWPKSLLGFFNPVLPNNHNYKSNTIVMSLRQRPWASLSWRTLHKPTSSH